MVSPQHPPTLPRLTTAVTSQWSRCTTTLHSRNALLTHLESRSSSSSLDGPWVHNSRTNGRHCTQTWSKELRHFVAVLAQPTTISSSLKVLRPHLQLMKSGARAETRNQQLASVVSLVCTQDGVSHSLSTATSCGANLALLRLKNSLLAFGRAFGLSVIQQTY